MYSWVPSQPADDHATVHQHNTGLLCCIAWLPPAPSSHSDSVTVPTSSGPTITAPQTHTGLSHTTFPPQLGSSHISRGWRQLLRAAGKQQKGERSTRFLLSSGVGRNSPGEQLCLVGLFGPCQVLKDEFALAGFQPSGISSTPPG